VRKSKTFRLVSKVAKRLIFSARKKDFRIDFYKAPGKGGQNKNKRETACRFTHIATGIVACSEKYRTQGRNKKAAFKKICDKLVEYYTKKDQKERYSASLEKTRTYHKPDDRVTDHVTGLNYSYKKTVGKGNIGEIIEDRIKYKNVKK